LGNIWCQNVERFLRGFINRSDVSTQDFMRELNARAFYDFTVTEPLIAPSIRWYAQTWRAPTAPQAKRRRWGVPTNPLRSRARGT